MTKKIKELCLKIINTYPKSIEKCKNAGEKELDELASYEEGKVDLAREIISILQKNHKKIG